MLSKPSVFRVERLLSLQTYIKICILISLLWPQIPRIPAEAEYFCRRKILMVNGMHTTLAFVTLCEKEPGALQGDSWKEHILLTPATASDEQVGDRAGLGRRTLVAYR